MGQKVHPHGLRLGTVFTWESRWIFANKKDYRTNLLADLKIRAGIIEKFKFAVVTAVEIERAINKVTIIIHSVKPGMIIGRGGKGLEDVKSYIVGIIGKEKVEKEKMKIDLKIEHVKKPYLNAFYVASDIASKIARRMPHRIVIHHCIDRVMEAGAEGVKVQIGGRINGASIARSEKYYQGTVPSSTIRENIDFAKFPSLTRSGYVGVKVWISRP